MLETKGEKMKIFSVIMAILILCALCVSGFVSWKSYQDKQKEEQAPPLEKFDTYLQTLNGTKADIAAWTKTGEQVIVLVNYTMPDSTVMTDQPEQFFKMDSTKGEKWFYRSQDGFHSIDIEKPAAKK